MEKTQPYIEIGNTATGQLDRRQAILSGSAAVVGGFLGACQKTSEEMEELWTQWQEDWRWMEAIARKRSWELTPLKIAPPASEAAIGRVETRLARDA